MVKSNPTGFKIESWTKKKTTKVVDAVVVPKKVEVQVVLDEATSVGEITLVFDPPHVLVPDFWKTVPLGDDYEKLSAEDKAKTDEVLAKLVSFAFTQYSDEPPQDSFDAKVTNFTRSSIKI